MATLYSPKIVTDGLTFAIDAGNTKSYPGSGTVWTDLTGNNYSGSLTNGPTFSTDGRGSIKFDGVNDYVVHTGTDGFGTANKAPAFSMCLWGKFTAALQHVAGFRNDTNYDLYFLLLGSTTEARIRTSTGNYDIVVTWTSYANSWTHIGFTGTSNRIDLYLNGVVVGSNTNVGGTFGATSSNFHIARNPDPTFPYYSSGYVGAVQFYNRTLSSTEVLQNYNATRSRFGV